MAQFFFKKNEKKTLVQNWGLQNFQQSATFNEMKFQMKTALYVRIKEHRYRNFNWSQSPKEFSQNK